MTSAHQMSSRKPPVAQSTFGFPDDPPRSADFSPPRISSAHRLSVGMLTPTAHPPGSPLCSLRPLRSLREAFSPHPLSLYPVSSSASASVLSNFQNVEKLSFQARLNCLYRQLENFFTASKVNIFPRPTPPIRRPAHPSTFNVQLETNSSPSLSLRPARLGALPKMREALSSPVLCLGELGGRPPGSRKNVEKISFGPHRLACTSRRKKLFHPHFSTFPPPKLSHCPLVLASP